MVEWFISGQQIVPISIRSSVHDDDDDDDVYDDTGDIISKLWHLCSYVKMLELLHFLCVIEAKFNSFLISSILPGDGSNEPRQEGSHK